MSRNESKNAAMTLFTNAPPTHVVQPACVVGKGSAQYSRLRLEQYKVNPVLYADKARMLAHLDKGYAFALVELARLLFTDAKARQRALSNCLAVAQTGKENLSPGDLQGRMGGRIALVHMLGQTTLPRKFCYLLLNLYGMDGCDVKVNNAVHSTVSQNLAILLNTRFGKGAAQANSVETHSGVYFSVVMQTKKVVVNFINSGEAEDPLHLALQRDKLRAAGFYERFFCIEICMRDVCHSFRAPPACDIAMQAYRVVCDALASVRYAVWGNTRLKYVTPDTDAWKMVLGAMRAAQGAGLCDAPREEQAGCFHRTHAINGRASERLRAYVCDFIERSDRGSPGSVAVVDMNDAYAILSFSGDVDAAFEGKSVYAMAVHLGGVLMPSACARKMGDYYFAFSLLGQIFVDLNVASNCSTWKQEAARRDALRAMDGVAVVDIKQRDLVARVQAAARRDDKLVLYANCADATLFLDGELNTELVRHQIVVAMVSYFCERHMMTSEAEQATRAHAMQLRGSVKPSAASQKLALKSLFDPVFKPVESMQGTLDTARSMSSCTLDIMSGEDVMVAMGELDE
jgi:hypothetical protein